MAISDRRFGRPLEFFDGSVTPPNTARLDSFLAPQLLVTFFGA